MLLLICMGSNAQETVLPRKNIETLDTAGTEFKSYIHALQILKDRAENDLYDWESLSWQSWVHNSSNVSLPTDQQISRNPGESDPEFFGRAANHTYPNSTEYGHPGQCVHRTDVFLGWHRAEFFYLEQILKSTDPNGTLTDSKGNKGPATANLRIPYWDFTNMPSGDRFPEVFEDPTSILYYGGRAEGKLKKPFYSKEEIAFYFYQDWPNFGGTPNGVGGDGITGSGQFELNVHNPMHNTGVGGLMRSDKTAAYDLIFFSFHAYIDLVYDQWITHHGAEDGGTMTSLDTYLRGSQPHKYNLPGWSQGSGVPETMGQVQLYTNHNDLGYTYLIGEEDKFPTNEAVIALLSDKKGVPFVFGEEKKSFATILAKNSMHTPSAERGQSVQSHHITVSDDDVINDYLDYETSVTTSYTVDVYIHPIDVDPDFSKKKFRNQYFVTSASHWGVPEGEESDHHAEDGSSINIYIGQALQDIQEHSDPSQWVITTNLTQH